MKTLIIVIFIIVSHSEQEEEEKMDKIQVVVQHFHGCPNGPKMIDSVKKAISEFGDKVELSEQIIDTPELAKKYSFRGSPTLLIEGDDFEDMPNPENPDLTCRFYPNGLPNVEKIIEKIKKYIH